MSDFLYIYGDYLTGCQPSLTLQINKLTIFTESKGQGEYHILVGKKRRYSDSIKNIQKVIELSKFKILFSSFEKK